MKTCNSCLKELPILNFYEVKKGTGKYRERCKKCYCSQQIKRDKRNDPDYQKRKYAEAKDARRIHDNYRQYQKEYWKSYKRPV